MHLPLYFGTFFVVVMPSVGTFQCPFLGCFLAGISRFRLVLVTVGHTPSLAFWVISFHFWSLVFLCLQFAGFDVHFWAVF
jgi:hypothetical protein